MGGKNEHGLDGHYTFVFDILNFNYVYWKYAGYAGLTSVDLVKKPLIISEPHESVKTMIDSFVAEQILQCCFYDSNATWNRGEFLIPKINEEFEDRYNKRSTIFDWRNRIDDLAKLSDTEKEAVSILKDKAELTLKLF